MFLSGGIPGNKMVVFYGKKYLQQFPRLTFIEKKVSAYAWVPANHVLYDSLKKVRFYHNIFATNLLTKWPW
jgi:hypothetical protein